MWSHSWRPRTMLASAKAPTSTVSSHSRSAILKLKKKKDFLKIRQFLKELYELQVLASTMNKPTLVAAGGHCFNSGATFFASLPFPVALDNLVLKHQELSNGLGLHAGALFFLSRMPGNAGKFYALTGLPFNRFDAKLLGYTDYLSEEGVNELEPFQDFPHKLHDVMKLRQTSYWDMQRYIDDDPTIQPQSFLNKAEPLDFLKEPEQQLQHEFINSFSQQKPYHLPDHETRDYNAGTNLHYKQRLMEKDRANAAFQWRNLNSRIFHQHEYPNYMRELLEVFEATLGEGENRLGFIQKKSSFYKNRAFIEKCFYPDNMEQIVENLERQLENPENSRMAEICLERVKQSPPLSLKGTLALLNKAKLWDYTTCLKEEYKLLWNLIKHRNFEAAMENRNTKSLNKWGLFSPSTLEDVTPEMVQSVLKPSEDMLTENPAEVNSADPLEFNVPTNALLPHRLHYHEFEDPIRLWMNQNRICFETYVRQNFYLQLKGQLLNRGIDYREGTVSAATVREAYYKQDLIRRLYQQQVYDLKMLSSYQEIADLKYHKILKEIGKYFSVEITEEGNLADVQPSRERLDRYTQDMNERVKRVFYSKWKSNLEAKSDRFQNARILQKRRMLLRLKKWIIQKRLLTTGNESIKLLTKRAALLPHKSFYIPSSFNERWRIGQNPELKKSIFYHIMKCISRDNVELPSEGLQDHLTNPGHRFRMSVNVLDSQALEELGRKLEDETWVEQIRRTIELDPDDELDKAIDREVEEYKKVKLGKLPLTDNSYFRMYFRNRELRKRKNQLQLNSFREAVRLALEKKREIENHTNLIDLDRRDDLSNLWKLVNQGQIQRLQKMHPELQALENKIASPPQNETTPSIKELNQNPLLALESYFKGDKKLRGIFQDQDLLGHPLVFGVFAPIKKSLQQFSKILAILYAEKEHIPAACFD